MSYLERFHPLKIYVAEAENGMVKFGVTTCIWHRTQAIAAAGPTRIRIIACFKGTKDEERELFRRFEHARAWGEWLYPTDGVMDFVNEIRGHGVECIPEWADIKYGREAHLAKMRDPEVIARRVAATRATRLAVRAHQVRA